MAVGTTKREFKWTRDTPNFAVYETKLGDGFTKVGVLYLPKHILDNQQRSACHHIEVITGSRLLHQCNCEYCVRRCG